MGRCPGSSPGQAHGAPLQQKFKIFIFALATVKNTVADIDTKATAKGAVNQKWLARWVGLGTTTVRKTVALEAERFGGPKGKNESKNRM